MKRSTALKVVPLSDTSGLGIKVGAKNKKGDRLVSFQAAPQAPKTPPNEALEEEEVFLDPENWKPDDGLGVSLKQVGRCSRCHRTVGFTHLKTVLCDNCIKNKVVEFEQSPQAILQNMVRSKSMAFEVPSSTPTPAAVPKDTFDFTMVQSTSELPTRSGRASAPLPALRSQAGMAGSPMRSPSPQKRPSRAKDKEADGVVVFSTETGRATTPFAPYNNGKNPYLEAGKALNPAELQYRYLKTSIGFRAPRARVTDDDSSSEDEGPQEASPIGSQTALSPAASSRTLNSQKLSKAKLDPSVITFFKELAVRKDKTTPFTHERFMMLRVGFDELDEEGSGSLSIKQLSRIGEVLFPNSFPTRRLKAADVDRGGTLDLYEIVKVAYPHLSIRETTRLADMYEKTYVPKTRVSSIPLLDRVRAKFKVETDESDFKVFPEDFGEIFSAYDEEAEKDVMREREEVERQKKVQEVQTLNKSNNLLEAKKSSKWKIGTGTASTSQPKNDEVTVMASQGDIMLSVPTASLPVENRNRSVKIDLTKSDYPELMVSPTGMDETARPISPRRFSIAQTIVSCSDLTSDMGDSASNASLTPRGKVVGKKETAAIAAVEAKLMQDGNTNITRRQLRQRAKRVSALVNRINKTVEMREKEREREKERLIERSWERGREVEKEEKPSKITQGDFNLLLEGYETLDQSGYTSMSKLQEMSELVVGQSSPKIQPVIKPHSSRPGTSFGFAALVKATYPNMNSESLLNQLERLQMPEDTSEQLKTNLQKNAMLDRMLSKYSTETVVEAAEIFALYDTDGSGGVEFEEFRDALEQYSEKELWLVFQEHDIDKNGILDFEEWFEIIKYSYPPYSTKREAISWEVLD